MRTNPQFTADLFTFTKEIMNGKLLFFAVTPADNYMFKVNNRNTRTRCETGSKLTTKTPE